MNGKKFPMDCTRDCPYYHCFDLSVDDYTNICDKLGVQVDDMDAYGMFYVPLNCPLDTTKEEKLCTDCKSYNYTCESPTHCTQDTKYAFEPVIKEGDNNADSN